MKKANQDIRDYAAKKGVYFWEIAMKLSISEPTMTRWMRVELPEDKRREIGQAGAGVGMSFLIRPAISSG